ncbi:MAG: hypothetical protein HYV63_25960 [Candidatus Schekmanbacteria bacterium]|nr:hypothetical protein [Candidatus Schekmanbacteria bacterium]
MSGPATDSASSFRSARNRRARALASVAFRVRLLIEIPGLLVVLALFSSLDVAPWRTHGLQAVVLVAMLVCIHDALRLSSVLASRSFPKLYMPAAIGLLTAMVFVTGGIYSPLVAAYALPAHLAGVFSARSPRLLLAPAAASAAVAGMGLLQGYGLVATPRQLGPADASPALLILQTVIYAAIPWIATLLAARTAILHEDVAAELLQARGALLEAHRDRMVSLEQLSRRVAHEVRNPLAAIKGLTQLLQRRGDPSGHLAVIASEVERLDGIVRDFLSFSVATDTARRTRADVAALARDVLVLLEERFRRAEVRVQDDLPPRSPALEMDQERMKQVLLNVLLNAIEAMESRPGGERRLVLGLQQSPQDLELTIADSGPGPGSGPAPSDEELERLFLPSVTTKANGTGLGLPISRAICRAHGGELTLRARPEGGAAAVLRLPLPAAAADAGIVAPPTAPATAPATKDRAQP